MSVLENLLSQATNPSNTTYNSDTLKVITELINRDPSDSIVALRLLAHKIQSPQDREALNSLKVLEWLTNNCSKHFITELGKFRFLNEIIKVLSPKHLGEQTSSVVKEKCIQLLYQWQRDFSVQEPKFAEAYKMLRQQGVITNEPANDMATCSANCRVNTQRSIFERNQQSSRLTELLRSRNPADVAEANRIIKTIVEEDERRLEQVTQRSTEMETLKNNSLLLGEMVNTFISGSSSHGELDLMEELAQNIRNVRPNLYNIPLTHQEQDMHTLTEIARICDQASTVLSTYEEKVRSNCLIQLPRATEETQTQKQHNWNDAVGEASDLDFLLSGQFDDSAKQSFAVSTESSSPVGDLLIPTTTPKKSTDILADIFSQVSSANPTIQASQPRKLPTDTGDPCPSGSSSNVALSRYQAFRQISDSSKLPPVEIKPSDPFDDLDSICRHMLSLTGQSTAPTATGPPPMSADHHEHSSLLSQNNTLPSATSSQPSPPSLLSPSAEPVQSTPVDWNSLEVSLSKIKPHPDKPNALRLFPCDGDETGVQLDLHYAANRPLPDVVVFVAVTSNRGAVSVSDLQLRFATNKPFQLRQLPASGSQLPAYSQFLPVGAISQVLLLRNPSHEEKFLLKFQLSFCLEGGYTVLEAGQQELLIGHDGGDEMNTG